MSRTRACASPLPLLDSGVDWITTTALAPHIRRKLWRTALKLIDAERDGDNRKRADRVRDYHGWRCGGVFVGERPDSVMVQASGEAARNYWRVISDCSTRVTRLDLQATVRDASGRLRLAHKARREALRGGGCDRPAQWVSIIDTHPAGKTCYIGAPDSDVRIRVYDKTAESGGAYPDGSWRYEVQARDGVARSLTASLVGGDGAGITPLSIVHNYLTARGVRPHFVPDGVGVLGHVPRSRSDVARKLTWLRTQVAPTVAWLSSRGRLGDALEAVGLPTDPDTVNYERIMTWLHGEAGPPALRG